MNLSKTSSILALLIGSFSCCKPKALPEPDQIPSGVSVTAVAVKKAFDDNWEVRLRLDNSTTSDFALGNLTDMQAYVQSAGGNRAQLHNLSVGRAKTLTVRAMSNQVTGLLFASLPQSPKELHLMGRVVQLPFAPPSTK